MAADQITYPTKEQGQVNPAPEAQKLTFQNANEIKTVVNANALKLGNIDLAGSTAIVWNPDFFTLDIPTGTGSTLQVGQEFYFLIHNDLGFQINNGQILKPVGAFVVGDNVIPTVILAKADNHETCDGTLFWATSDIADGTLGMATRLGRVNDINTDGLTPGVDIFLSATVAGGFTTTRPSFPNYVLSVGGVLKADPTGGQVAASFQKRVEDTLLNAWDGSIRENFDFLVTSNGTVITGAIEKTGGGDITLLFSDGFTTFDTTPPATIVLTPGTDTVPVMNFIYILMSDKILTVSTVEWPTPEHIKVADILLYSASLTQTDGALSNRNWNDHIKLTGDNGHLLHIADRLRQLPASWDSGVALSTTLVGASTPDDLFVSVAPGIVYQLHRQTFTALDLQTGDVLYVRNHNTTPFFKTSNLNTQILDTNGVTLNNTSFSFVIWGVVTKEGEVNHLILNLPTGSYAFVNPTAALEDSNNYANYTIPSKFKGTGFLIARLVLTFKNDVWTVENNVDLRGSFPNNTVGVN